MSLLNAHLPVQDSSRTGEARRMAAAAAGDLGFSATQQGRVAIVATELATNLVKHTHGGEFMMRELRSGEITGMELMTVDSGPGFADPSQVMSDGFSTAGSPGNGLGAVKRLSHSFDMYSQHGRGSVFVAQLWSREGTNGSNGIQYGVVEVPHPYEEVSGDAWLIEGLGEGRYLTMIADGLGHGQLAADAGQRAVEGVQKGRGKELEEILRQCHGMLHATRGAAMALALIDNGTRVVQYAGVGNIVAGIVSPESGTTRRMISHDGTVGHILRKVQKFAYPWPENGVLIMHSDGMTANWNLERYPGLLRRLPSVIAGVLYRDCRRKNDDVTILVAREV